MAKILVLDNYDSFTYNLVHYLKREGPHQIAVVRNDEVDLEEVEGYAGVVLSPGPGIPSEAGQLLRLIDITSGFMAGRYHSWVADRESLPGVLRIDAEDDHGYIMALSHQQYDICGVQFHPESILTPGGETMISNWLNQF